MKIDFPFLIVAKIRILFDNGKKKEKFLVYSLPFDFGLLFTVYGLPFDFGLRFDFGLQFTVYCLLF